MRVLRVLERETDADHRLTLSDMMDRLGMPYADSNGRRNVLGDIAALKDAGYPIESERHRAPEYYFARRRFSAKELKVLVDIVQSSRTIPQEMSEGMVKSVLSLGSDFEADEVRTGIRVGNRVKLFNAELPDSIWEIKRAMDGRRKVRFRYFSYGFDFQRCYHPNADGGDIHVETPLLLTHVDGAHYVITYNDEMEMKKTRRVDRMTDVAATDVRATRRQELRDFDIDERALFGMFIGEETYVTLTVKERGMNVMVDRFGRNMEVANVREVREGDEVVRYADVTVKVAESPQFEGWLKGLEGLVERKVG